MIPTHAQQQFSAAAAAPVWEQDAGASVANNDNAWLLSFIDILALLLTLFVLLLAYESQGPETAGTATAVDTAVAAQPERVAVFEPPAAPAADSIPAPIALFTGLSPVLTGAEPSFIDLPITDVVSPRRPLPAAEPAVSDAASPAAGAVPGADASAVDTVATISSENSSAVQPVTQVAGDEVPPLTPALPLAEPATAASPLPIEKPSAVEFANSLPGSPVTEAAAPPAASPQDALLAALDSSGLRQRIDVAVSGDVVNIAISDNILFMPASAALSADGARVLAELAAAFAAQPYTVSVEGHTDNVPIQTVRFPSNWELSSARAAMVTRKLIERGVAADRIRAIGYGDTRPRADNETPQGRAKNRRVSFILQASSATPADSRD